VASGPWPGLCEGVLPIDGAASAARCCTVCCSGLIEARRIFQSEAPKDGLAAAVAAGRKPGRRPGPPLLTHAQEELAHQLQATGRSVTEIADLGVSRAAMYRARSPSRPPTTGEDSAL
jgi:hypothetical protein